MLQQYPPPQWARVPPSLWRLQDHIHLDTTQSVELLWMGDQPDAETSTSKHTTVTTDRHDLCGIRIHNLRQRKIADSRFRP